MTDEIEQDPLRLLFDDRLATTLRRAVHKRVAVTAQGDEVLFYVIDGATTVAYVVQVAALIRRAAPPASPPVSFQDLLT